MFQKKVVSIFVFFILPIIAQDMCSNYKSTLSAVHSAMQELLNTQKLMYAGLQDYEKNYTLLLAAFCCTEKSNEQLMYEKELWLKLLSSLEKNIINLSIKSEENRVFLQTIQKLSNEIQMMHEQEYHEFLANIREIVPSCVPNS